LEVEGTQAGAFKVGAEDLVSLTKENMIALDATSKVGVCQELVSVGGTFITANGDKVGFRQQIQGFLGGGDGGHGMGKLGKEVIDGVDVVEVVKGGVGGRGGQ
jgi:hypothetical protein